MTFEPFRHQRAALKLIRTRDDIPYVFLIGGFGCGKSTTDVMLLLTLISYYMNSPIPVTFGLIGVTIKLLSQTVLKDLRAALDNAGILYKDNTMKGQFSVGNITFIYLAMSNPEDIYAHNFCGAIIDEMDELPPDRVLEVVKAVQERCRVCCPPPLNREPFLFFSTTAQGLGGTYQLTEYCKKKGIKYAIVKGKTEYNTSLAKSQIELLRKLYTPEEARAYLDGEFVNLSTGRVYPEFNRKQHVHMAFDIKPGTPVYNEQGKVIRYEGGDVIYAGQDFNSGYNACTIGIERNGVIYVIDAKHWDYVGDGARCLREMYPNNRIILIPDANGKEIMTGFVEEFENYNIEIWWNNVNPSITERIMGVNKAFRWGQLMIFEGLDETTMCLETRDFDDAGKPRKGKGPKALDHWGDSLEYMFWHIIHQIKGYDQILTAIRAIHSPSLQQAA